MSLTATRRRLLQLGLAGGLVPALSLPFLSRPARAEGSAADRRFLFIFCQGGWDPAWAFAPLFDSGRVDMPSEAAAAEVEGIPFVDVAAAPSVRGFFEQFGDQTCVINGLEIQAVAHSACERIAMTNSATEGGDDWAAILAGNAHTAPLIPHLHVSGPAFGNRFASSIVRGGTSGQLASLLDGEALARSDLPAGGLSESALRLADARSLARAQRWASTAPAGRGAQLGEAAVAAEGALGELTDLSDMLVQGGSTALVDRLALPLAALSAGVSRTAMVSYKAWDNVFNGWDTHQDVSLQANHYEELFAALTTVLPALGSNTTVVVLSEMGRFPRINTTGGKDHWTYTSAMLIGAGVAGGQAIGAYDSELLGLPVDLASGALHSGGTSLLAGHLGATLLALGDVDPAEYVRGASPILAAIR